MRVRWWPLTSRAVILGPRRGRVARLAGVLAAVATIGVAGCRQDMHDAPRYDPLEASPVFADGSSARMLVPGTVARGELNEDELFTTGKSNGQVSDVFPFQLSAADLDRGQERFNIYCSPCHGRTAEGNGMVVQRGFRQPPSFHTDRLRQSGPGYFFDVMTNGFATMPDYRAQVTVADRWRIAAYVKALQLTRQGTTADLSAENLARLQAGEVAPAPPAVNSGAEE
jgi:mono/diheme cytochrome c family protein